MTYTDKHFLNKFYKWLMNIDELWVYLNIMFNKFKLNKLKKLM